MIASYLRRLMLDGLGARFNRAVLAYRATEAASTPMTETTSQAAWEIAGDSPADAVPVPERDVGGGSRAPHFFAYPVELSFCNLRANSEARVWLDAGGTARWGGSDPRSALVGASVASSPRGSTMALSTFLINHCIVFLSTYQACPEIRVRLYVHTLEKTVCGRVDLPPGATLTIETPVDRTTLAERGLSSYALTLG